MTPKEKLALVLIVFVGFIFRFYFFMDSSIWADEGQHIWIALSNTWFGMRDVYQTTAHDQPFGMYPLLHAWGNVVGWSPAALRAFSVLASGLSVFTTALATWWILPRSKAFLLSALLMAVSPFSIRYGYDVTPYALVNLFAPISIGLFVRKFRETEGIINVPWLIVNAALLNIHYFSYFLVGSECLLWFAFAKGKWGEKIVSAVYAFAVYVICSLPVLLLFDPVGARFNHKWIQRNQRSTLDIILHLFSYGAWLQWTLVFIFVLLFGFTFAHWKKMDRDRRNVLVGLIGVISLTTIYAYMSRWLFWNVLGHERYLMVVYPGVILLLVFLLENAFQNKIFKKVAVFVVVSAFVAGVVFYQPHRSIQDFNSATQFIAEHDTGDVFKNVLLTPECCAWPIYYYLTLRNIYILHPIVDPEGWKSDPKYLQMVLKDKGLLFAKKYFMVVYYEALPDLAYFKKSVEPLFELEAEKSFDGVSVVVYHPKRS